MSEIDEESGEDDWKEDDSIRNHLHRDELTCSGIDEEAHQARFKGGKPCFLSQYAKSNSNRKVSQNDGEGCLGTLSEFILISPQMLPPGEIA